MSAPPPLSVLESTLTPNGQRARYGVSYVRNVCAQAGYGMNETSPDEDVLAIDCEVLFQEASVRVQVKCTSQLTIAGKTKSWKVRPEWINAWAGSKVPVYFVLVVVPKSEPKWLEHKPDGTFHRTAGFWTRVDATTLGKSISIAKTSRLTAATLTTWRNDLRALFGGAAA